MTEREQWDLLVTYLKSQGMTGQEIMDRIQRGETVKLNFPVAKTEWRGLYGTTE